MNYFQTVIDEPNDSVRDSLYRGQLFLLPATAASRSLVTEIGLAVEAELGACGSARTAQFHLSDSEYFTAVGRLRKLFYTERKFHERVLDVMVSVGFNPPEHAFDPIRLRAVAHNGHMNPAAGPLYYGHRDTWYSNPQSMITWWIPLHDVRPEETFDFFPEEFGRVALNDSECFDFEAWVEDGQTRRIGWQDSQTSRTARYPQLLSRPAGPIVPVACRAGDILLFSGQHLHQTRHNQTGQTRFSVDFRTVHLEDHARDRVAPNVDNRSTGSSLRQMIRGIDLGTGRGAAASPLPVQS